MDVDERLTRPTIDKDHPSDFTPAYATRTQWEQRAAALRTQAQVALGLWPMPSRPKLHADVAGMIERDDYTIENVFFDSLPGHRVAGNLYRPRTPGPHPAVLHPHGHFEGGRLMWRSDEQVERELATGAERTADAARAPLQAMCATLAHLGCIVFHYDMVGYGDSTAPAHREGFLDAESLLRLQSFMGLQTWNGLRALDFLLQLPDVDATRVGLVGASSGATQLIALAALDDRVTCTCPIVMVSMAMQGGCVCENAPLYRIGTNNAELACLSAPRPQEAIAAQDWTKEFERRGLPEMKAIYQLYVAESSMTGVTLPFPHNVNVHSRERAYAFLSRHLRLGGRRVTEPAFVPVGPSQLSIYGKPHTRPDREADAAEIRAWMSATAEESLHRLRLEQPDDYCTTVRAALRAMTASELPAEVETVGGPVALAAGVTWSGFIGRAGSEERVGCLIQVPRMWDGQITVVSHVAGTGGEHADGNRAVVSIDLFPGNGRPTPAEQSPKAPNPRYAGYWLGYVRSTVAERAHDLLTAIALARRLSKSGRVHVFAAGGTLAWAVPAIALAGGAVASSTLIDDGWDYDQIVADDDPLLLPGALKYGGLRGMMAAFAHAPEILPEA